MNRGQLRQKAIEHYKNCEDFNIGLAMVLMKSPTKTLSIQDLIYTYEEPQKTEQELLKERLQEVWPQW